jgi:Tfp pilus assembly protein PilE
MEYRVMTMISQTTASSRALTPTGTGHRSPATGFTIIELVMVLVVILMLFLIVTPMFVASMDRSRMTKAHAETMQLQAAWAEYYRTYNAWFTDDNFEMSAEKTQILGGHVGALNTNGTKFMRCTVEQMNNGFKDPWDAPYNVAFTDNINSTNRIYQSKVFFKHASRYR